MLTGLKMIFLKIIIKRTKILTSSFLKIGGGGSLLYFRGVFISAELYWKGPKSCDFRTYVADLQSRRTQILYTCQLKH